LIFNGARECDAHFARQARVGNQCDTARTPLSHWRGGGGEAALPGQAAGAQGAVRLSQRDFLPFGFDLQLINLASQLTYGETNS